METRTKQNLIVTIVGVSLFAALMNYSAVLGFVEKIIHLILPIIVGGILALFISVPMNGIEKRLKNAFQGKKKQPSDKVIHVLSFVITMLCILLVLVLVMTLLIPEIIQSCESLYQQIKANIPKWIAYLDNDKVRNGWLEQLLTAINWEQLPQSLSKRMDSLVVNVVDALSSTVSVITTSVFAIIISIYISLGRERLFRHGRKLISAYLKPSWAKNFLHFCNVFRQSFTNFLTGQCSEAIILGMLMFLAFSIFRLPYGSLVGILTAFCAIIPYVGAFISCSVSVFLILLIDPMLALRSLIIYLVVQFIENQFIYPRVVGSSVGLSPFYTLIAAMIGGKLFGIIGIIFFIPLVAVIIELVKEDVTQRLQEREKTDI